MFDISAAGTLSPQIRARFASKHAIQCRWRRRRQRPQLILMTSTGPRSERSGTRESGQPDLGWLVLCMQVWLARAGVSNLCRARKWHFFSSSSWETGANFALECLRLGGGSSQDSRRVERIKQRKKTSYENQFFVEVSFLCATELSLAVCVRDSIKTAFFSLCWWMNVWRCGGGSARLACKCGVLEMWECTFLHRHHTHSFCLIFLCLLCVSVCLFALYVCWWWTLRRYIVVILSFIVDEGGGFLSRKNLLFHSGWLRLSEKK